MGGWINFQSTAIGGIATGSAYSAYDAVGGAFTIPLAAGEDGGVAYNMTLIDRGTANAALRLHLFTTGFSASLNGVTFQVADVDESNYLGYVDVGAGDWVTGGTAKNIASVKSLNMGIYAPSAVRVIHAQFSCPGTPTFGATANPLRLNTLTIYD